MQVTERAASEWVKETRVENFRVEELFNPKVNLQAGTWYLARAIQHWKAQADPVPFALAEYNAGASRAQRWAGGDDITLIFRPIPSAPISTFQARANTWTRSWLALISTKDGAECSATALPQEISRRRNIRCPVIGTLALIVWMSSPSARTVSSGVTGIQSTRSADFLIV